MDDNDYFKSGYTGFCPDKGQRIGENSSNSTRDIIRQKPYLRGRLGGILWQEVKTGDVSERQGEGYECAFKAMPDYPSGYTGHIPSNLWTFCERDDKKDGKRDDERDDRRCPLKAYPLSCSEYGSKCTDKRCDDGFNYCSIRQNQNRGEQGRGDHKLALLCTPVSCQIQQDQSDKASQACCNSCAGGDPCEAGAIVRFSTNKLYKACCESCAKGDPCEGDRNQYLSEALASKSCCSSCSKGGACKGEEKQSHSSKKSNRSFCNSCSKCETLQRREGPCPSDHRFNFPTSCPSDQRFNFLRFEATPYRKCGVIPNYMGYIPGLYKTFGETYGLTANRLLRKHFWEQDNIIHK